MRKKGLKKLQAREVVMLSVMTALCVVANTICSHTIPLHAGTAIVILSGISLGPGPGAFIGVLGRFVCNFFDGQGPWTIWQMGSWGLLAAISGLCFQPIQRKTLLEKRRRKKQSTKEIGKQLQESLMIFICVMVSLLCGCFILLLKGKNIEAMFGWRLYAWGFAGLLIGCLVKKKKLTANRLVLAIYTLVTVFIIYGGIMNMATLFLQHMANSGENPLNLEVLCALYLTGVPYDFAHGAGAAICIFFIGESLLQKMERIQIKYQIFPKDKKEQM